MLKSHVKTQNRMMLVPLSFWYVQVKYTLNTNNNGAWAYRGLCILILADWIDWDRFKRFNRMITLNCPEIVHISSRGIMQILKFINP